MSFALFLFILLSVTGVVWLLEIAVLSKKRSKDAKQPWWIEYSVSFFPVILIVFMLVRPTGLLGTRAINKV